LAPTAADKIMKTTRERLNSTLTTSHLKKANSWTDQGIDDKSILMINQGINYIIPHN
jgi:hypothetical protein